MMNILIRNHATGGSQLNTTESIGDCQPPKNMIAQSALISHMFMYSAMKNSAKVMPEYSTMWPATISDSPSTTSKGARLVSATPLTKYTTAIGRGGRQFPGGDVSPLEEKEPRRGRPAVSGGVRLSGTIRTTTTAK